MARLYLNHIQRVGRRRYRIRATDSGTVTSAGDHVQSVTLSLTMEPIPWWKFWVRK